MFLLKITNAFQYAAHIKIRFKMLSKFIKLPCSTCPSLQLNVSKAPTAYFLWPGKTPDVESILPFNGISGWGH